MTWIAPDNLNLATITGMSSGLGLNPVSTFDWNTFLSVLGESPLVLPFFNVANTLVGMLVSLPIIAALWYTNTWNTGYLPINSNGVFDHFGLRYNVSRAIDHRGMFDAEKYENYSPAYLASANLVVYMIFFAVYSATVSYAYLYHRHEIMMGMRNLFKRGQKTVYNDVHNRLMAKYPEGQFPFLSSKKRIPIAYINFIPTSFRVVVSWSSFVCYCLQYRWHCWMGNIYYPWCCVLRYSSVLGFCHSNWNYHSNYRIASHSKVSIIYILCPLVDALLDWH